MDTSNDHKISKDIGKKMSKEITEQRCEDNTDYISQIYKIFKKIYLTSPPILKDLTDESVDIDYKESLVDNYIDFKKICNNFKDQKYSSITDAIKDIRLVFLNCYKFYGAKSDHTIKLLEIEEELEHQIGLLDEDLKLFANIQLTLKLLEPYLDRKQNFYFRYPKDCYDSILLRSVAHCRPERLKEYHNILSSKLTTNADNAHILEGLQHWENEIYFNDNYKFISSMWELPEIGNFVAIIFKELDYEIVNQGEIERMFLMPKESTTMSKIMTTLLMPIKKPKYIGREMPYKVWSEKLCKKVSEWYKVYHIHKRNKVYVLNSLGIHPDFWSILGDENPLVKFDYSELKYFIKVWVIKGLCDYVINKYKTINNIIINCNERQCTIWKNDMETEEYFYFSSMPDLRIYYYNIPTDEPNLKFLESEKIKEKTETDGDNVYLSSNTFGCTKSHDTSHFKLIADSVQGLRSFLDELDIEDSSIPETLINALEKLIFKMEPQEYHLIMTNNNSKIKLFNDWKSYPERFLKEKDEIIFWEEKEVKTTSDVLAVNEAIICEKRQRKSVIKEKLVFDTCYSDGYRSENNNESSVTDFLDSEDDWEAMNRPKSKTKLPVLSSKQKLDDLGKQMKNKSELPLDNNKLDGKKQDLRSEISEISDDKSEKSQVVECIMENNDEIISIKDNDEIISIEDDDDDDNINDEHIVISDDDVVIESISITPGAAQVQKPSVQISGYYSLNNNFNQQTIVDSSMRQRASSIRQTNFPIRQEAVSPIRYAAYPIDQTALPMRQAVSPMCQAVSPMRQAATPMRQATSRMHRATSRIHRAAPRRISSTTIPSFSPNISIMPANVHLPKGIEVSIVKGPQPKINSHFNTTKRPATIRSNGFTKNNPSVVNVECRVISKPNLNGEVMFYVKLPNGELHPVSHELINEYLRNHNNSLPDYWIVPLPVEVAKHFTNI
ncbi:Bromodomain [Cinara cedri]|uniref:Bromodomain n=1 Tax=Cinara cedri TaxID=506608 RepID=A0A5E4MD53_9HEMI|nr:Bromodomain [Cinara cedri]